MEDLNIRHFKLLNGEDIVAAVSAKNKDSWLLERPVIVQNNILGGFSFAPWFPFSKTKVFKVYFSNVINSTGIDADVKESYINFVLDMKQQMNKIDKGNQQMLAEMEADIEDRMEQMFEEGGLIKKKRVLH